MATQNSSSLTETFELLASPYRRYVLYYLTSEVDRVDIETLAGALTAWDRGQAAPGLSDSEVAVETALYHTHLPKLAEAGIVRFDRDSGVIELDDTNGHEQFIIEAARIDGVGHTAVSD